MKVFRGHGFAALPSCIRYCLVVRFYHVFATLSCDIWYCLEYAFAMFWPRGRVALSRLRAFNMCYVVAHASRRCLLNVYTAGLDGAAA